MAHKANEGHGKYLGKYLVVSYDDDQQQWFWDFVLAESEDGAKDKVLKARSWVVAADAISLCGLEDMTAQLGKLKPAKIESGWRRLLKREGAA